MDEEWKNKTYSYNGPVYNYYGRFIENVQITTTAVSRAKAVCNFEYRLRTQTGQWVKIDSSPKYLTEK